MNPIRLLSGRLAVGSLNLLGRIPLRVSFALGSILLPLYIPFRRATRKRLRNLPEPIAPRNYYHMRLRLALLSLRQFLGRDDEGKIQIEGSAVFADALASGSPVVLLGWHQGPVELLHRIPARHAKGPINTHANSHTISVMTASAFSPVLADWMARGRIADGVQVIRPSESARISALRAWAKATDSQEASRSPSVLALMVDQVPGTPQHYWSLWGGAIRIPRPERLLAWIMEQRPVCIAVSTRLEAQGRIVFRYERVRTEAWEADLSQALESALARVPEQYNWSYGKIAVAG